MTVYPYSYDGYEMDTVYDSECPQFSYEGDF